MSTKQVSFAPTTTVVEFRIAHNPSTVPHVGPSIGLVGQPIRVSRIPTDDGQAPRGTKRGACYMEPVRRVLMLRREGYTMEDIARICIEADQVKRLRKDSVIEYLVEKKRLEAQTPLVTTPLPQPAATVEVRVV